MWSEANRSFNCLQKWNCGSLMVYNIKPWPYNWIKSIENLVSFIFLITLYCKVYIGLLWPQNAMTFEQMSGIKTVGWCYMYTKMNVQLRLSKLPINRWLGGSKPLFLILSFLNWKKVAMLIFFNLIFCYFCFQSRQKIPMMSK